MLSKLLFNDAGTSVGRCRNYGARVYLLALCVSLLPSIASAFLPPLNQKLLHVLLAPGCRSSSGSTVDKDSQLNMSNSEEKSNSEKASSKKSKHQPMLNFMDKPMANTVGDDPRPDAVPIEADPSADLVRCIVKAADGRKAENIVALRVSPVSTLTSFLVILSGNSRPQNQAIAAAIRKDVAEEYGLKSMGSGVPEGTAESGWMLLDFGSVMVHIMTAKSRLYYNIEGQWRAKGGIEMDLSDVIIPNSVESPSMGTTMDIEQEEDDPFWS